MSTILLSQERMNAANIRLALADSLSGHDAVVDISPGLAMDAYSLYCAPLLYNADETTQLCFIQWIL